MTDNTQPEALRLAEILEGDYCPDWFYEQGVEFRPVRISQ